MASAFTEHECCTIFRGMLRAFGRGVKHFWTIGNLFFSYDLYDIGLVNQHCSWKFGNEISSFQEKK